MAYLTNLLPNETELGCQHQGIDAPGRVGAVPHLFGLKVPSENLRFPEGWPLLEYPVATEPVDPACT